MLLQCWRAEGEGEIKQQSAIAEGGMWGFLIGLYIAMLIYPFIEEWQQRRADKGRLAKMRAYHATGRRWDVTKGQWIDE
jgi:hypothetical protein